MNKKSIAFKFFINSILISVVLLNILLAIQVLVIGKLFDLGERKAFIKITNEVKDNYESNNLSYRNNILLEAEENNFEIDIVDKNGVTIDPILKGKEKTNKFNLGKSYILKNYLLENFNKLTSFNLNDEYSGGNNTFIVTLIKMNNKTEYLITMDKFKLTSSIIDTIQYFYLLLFVIMVIFIFVLSYFYSRIMAKPLIEMDEIAKKMVKLDFSKKIVIKADDEVGSLSRSLNQLSEKLDLSIKNLELKNIQLKEFTSNASHELKTPLSIISGYVEGIKDGIYKNEDGKHLTLIENEISKMNVLITDMLGVFKSENQNLSLNCSEFSFNDLLDSMLFRFQHEISDKSITIVRAYLKENVKVIADKDKVEQILENLISNGIKYTTNERKIIIKLDSIGDCARFSIENSCSNINEEDMQKIWDRFYVIEKSHNKSLSGTGLGLSIVENLLIAHESDFGVSNTSLGLEFYFTLKLKR